MDYLPSALSLGCLTENKSKATGTLEDGPRWWVDMRLVPYLVICIIYCRSSRAEVRSAASTVGPPAHKGSGWAGAPDSAKIPAAYGGHADVGVQALVTSQGQGCIGREGAPEEAPEAVVLGGWRRLPKRLGAATVGYKCRWGWQLRLGRERLGHRLGPWRG